MYAYLALGVSDAVAQFMLILHDAMVCTLYSGAAAVVKTPSSEGQSAKHTQINVAYEKISRARLKQG